MITVLFILTTTMRKEKNNFKVSINVYWVSYFFYDININSCFVFKDF